MVRLRKVIPADVCCSLRHRAYAQTTTTARGAIAGRTSCIHERGGMFSCCTAT